MRCAERLAVCTSDGRPPTNTTTVTIAGPDPDDEEEEEGFSSSFVGVPNEHDGVTPFGFTRDDDTYQNFTITVTPDSTSTPITIDLSATTDCTADGAICTAEGKPLVERQTATIGGSGS